MKLLIELGAFPETQDALISACRDLKIEYTLWDHKSYPPYKPNDNQVWFYGTIPTALNLKNAKYSYQIWLGKEFDFTYFTGHLNGATLNQIFAVVPFGHLPFIVQDEDIFIRSNSGYKVLGGGIDSVENVVKDANLFKEELVVLAEKQFIKEEYRCIVRASVNEEKEGYVYDIIGSSLYIRHEEMVDSTKGLSEKNSAVLLEMMGKSSYGPYPLFIVDVALLINGQLKIIEANSINTSGLYGCDLKKMVETINSIIETEVQRVN